MFNKYKKKILLILTLVFLFNFSFGYKRADASVLVAGGVGLGVLLLVGAGVAITSPQMAQDLGGRLWEGLKEIGEVPKKVGDFFKVQITGAMLEFTSNWINSGNIPKEPVQVPSGVLNGIELPYSVPSEEIRLNLGLKGIEKCNYTKLTLKYTDGGVSKTKDFKVNRSFLDSNLEITVRAYFSSTANKNLFVFNTIDSVGSGYNQLDVDSTNIVIQDMLFTIDGTAISYKDLVGEGTITIPYSPEVSSGASEEKLTTSLPVGSTLTYPSDLTTNFPATADKPIANVTDIPGVQVDTNVNTETGVIEGTLTNIAELLQSLVNAITNIFIPPMDDLVPLDLSPLYFGITDKFPFSVPFDLIKTFQNMSDSSKAPRFEVKFPEKYFGSYTFVIDFEQFNDFVLILRYFLLLSFIIFLILQTRNIIGG